MSKRLLLAVSVLSTAIAIFPASPAAAIKAFIYPFTGEIRLVNPDVVAFPFVGYEIFYSNALPAGGLNGANGVWTSIADTYDAPPGGNGFIDPVNQWQELPWNSRDLAEGLFVGSGSRLPAQSSIGLGKVWSPSVVASHDLMVNVVQDGQPNPFPITVQLAIDGDYTENRIVDDDDYTLWKLAFGTNFLAADGNHNGVVDAADYTVWRDHRGQTLIGSPLADGDGSSTGMTLAVQAVPEPASLGLAIGAGGILLLWRVRRLLRR